MNKTVLAALALLCFACGASKSSELPDGGQGRQVCSTEFATLVVKVVDEQGQPVEGATVTAKNVGTGKTVTGTTNGQGSTSSVNQDIGTGTVRLSATANGLASQPAQVEFSCGECNCTVEPKSVTLKLSP
jgi:hypothetical protein